MSVRLEAPHPRDVEPAPEALWPRLRRALLRPVDPASLVVFRIAFGAIMFWEVVRYFEKGWIPRYWITPEFHFTYFGFSWVKPWPGDGMYVHMGVLGILAILIFAGFWYRAAAALFFLGFTYMFLLEEARYLNHFYFLSLLSFLMVLVPANRAFSVDALFGRKPTDTRVPAWSIWTLRFQLFVLYTFGGIAKINGDWLRGEPLRDWLWERADYPVLGPFFATEIAPYAFSYGGLLLDLFVAPALLWRRTRIPAFLALTCFHCLNAWIFSIGIFPWIALAASTIFFAPGWPRRLLPRRGGKKASRAPATPNGPLRPKERLLLGALALFAAWQLLMPLRHFLYPGEVSWTEEGHRFSWHMKLRDKGGRASFVVSSPSAGIEWDVDARRYLQSWQARKMTTRPDMILEFAHHLAAEKRRQGYEDAEVRVRTLVTLNGRAPQPMIDETVDLAKHPRSLLPARYIVPLRNPLPPRSRGSGTRGGAGDDDP